mgnify:CR=1 FL=1
MRNEMKEYYESLLKQKRWEVEQLKSDNEQLIDSLENAGALDGGGGGGDGEKNPAITLLKVGPLFWHWDHHHVNLHGEECLVNTHYPPPPAMYLPPVAGACV